MTRGLRRASKPSRAATRPRAALRFYADAALHLFDPLPYAVGKYRSSEVSAR